jgi:hypothetical protein
VVHLIANSIVHGCDTSVASVICFRRNGYQRRCQLPSRIGVVRWTLNCFSISASTAFGITHLPATVAAVGTIAVANSVGWRQWCCSFIPPIRYRKGWVSRQVGMCAISFCAAVAVAVAAVGSGLAVAQVNRNLNLSV